MEDEAAPAFDRAAEMDRTALAHALGGDLELAHHLAQADALYQFVNEEPHRAFLVVGAHQDDRAREARVLHLRHGDEQLAG